MQESQRSGYWKIIWIMLSCVWLYVCIRISNPQTNYGTNITQERVQSKDIMNKSKQAKSHKHQTHIRSRIGETEGCKKDDDREAKSSNRKATGWSFVGNCLDLLGRIEQQKNSATSRIEKKSWSRAVIKRPATGAGGGLRETGTGSMGKELVRRITRDQTARK